MTEKASFLNLDSGPESRFRMILDLGNLEKSVLNRDSGRLNHLNRDSGCLNRDSGRRFEWIWRGEACFWLLAGDFVS